MPTQIFRESVAIKHDERPWRTTVAKALRQLAHSLETHSQQFSATPYATNPHENDAYKIEAFIHKIIPQDQVYITLYDYSTMPEGKNL